MTIGIENEYASYEMVYFKHKICLVVFHHRHRLVCVHYLVIYANFGQIGSKNSPLTFLCGVTKTENPLFWVTEGLP